MQKTSFYKWLLLLGLFTALAIATSHFLPAEARRALLSNPPNNQVVVKLKSGVSINTILTRYNAAQLDIMTETNLYLLQLPSGQTADQILPTLNADTDLWYAEPNYYVDVAPDGSTLGFGGTTLGFGGTTLGFGGTTLGFGGTTLGFGGTTLGFGGTGSVTPTPGGGADQWAWLKIARTDAQKISTGQGIIVAVLDTGLTADHPLLQSNITAGYDFVKMTGTFLDAGNGLDDDRNGTVDDFVGHGTHVSGIIVSAAPSVQIMPIRVLNSDGSGTYWEVSQGIRYAVDHGAKVINMSLTASRLTPSLSDALAYAASHGVIVVAAAGNNNPGPSYPASYSDPLAVIGVGASDRNDAIASFSGGLPADTDVFAPGVDIYSSFPYNGYALGTGTSMAAPIVSAEAALLIARHPDWSAAEVEQRIIAKGATVSGSSAKRIDLAGALNTGIEVDHSTPDMSASPTDQYILPRMRLFNNTPLDIPLSELKLRYWYTPDSLQAQTFHCDYGSTLGCPTSNIAGAFTTIVSNSPNKTSLSDTYLEVGFGVGAGNLIAGNQLEMYLRIYKTDMSNFSETNDYSYDPSRPDMARWDRITVYRNGVLVWGIEPTSSSILTATPTRTATVVVANTATRTNTPGVPANTNTPTTAPSTATRTNTPGTPAAPTATYTKTSTPAGPTATSIKTSTPAGPTATYTKTSTPAGPTATASASSLKVKLEKDPAGSDTAQSSPFYIQITNTGATSKTGITVRIYFTIDGSYNASQYVLEKYYDQCGATVQAPTLVSGSTYYFTLNCGTNSLAAGATWQINMALHLSDWSSNLNATNDWWHTSGALPITYMDWTYLPAYVNSVRVWGVEPP